MAKQRFKSSTIIYDQNNEPMVWLDVETTDGVKSAQRIQMMRDVTDKQAISVLKDIITAHLGIICEAEAEAEAELKAD